MLPFDDDELLEPVKNVLEEVRPFLQNDGGDVELIEIKDGVVKVKFEGACGSCSISNTTLNNIILKALKEGIHPEIEVQRV